MPDVPTHTNALVQLQEIRIAHNRISELEAMIHEMDRRSKAEIKSLQTQLHARDAALSKANAEMLALRGEIEVYSRRMGVLEEQLRNADLPVPVMESPRLRASVVSSPESSIAIVRRASRGSSLSGFGETRVGDPGEMVATGFDKEAPEAQAGRHRTLGSLDGGIETEALGDAARRARGSHRAGAVDSARLDAPASVKVSQVRATSPHSPSLGSRARRMRAALSFGSLQLDLDSTKPMSVTMLFRLVAQLFASKLVHSELGLQMT